VLEMRKGRAPNTRPGLQLSDLVGFMSGSRNRRRRHRQARETSHEKRGSKGGREGLSPARCSRRNRVPHSLMLMADPAVTVSTLGQRTPRCNADSPAGTTKLRFGVSTRGPSSGSSCLLSRLLVSAPKARSWTARGDVQPSAQQTDTAGLRGQGRWGRRAACLTTYVDQSIGPTPRSRIRSRPAHPRIRSTISRPSCRTTASTA
jgi:hypothetical protein